MPTTAMMRRAAVRLAEYLSQHVPDFGEEAAREFLEVAWTPRSSPATAAPSSPDRPLAREVQPTGPVVRPSPPMATAAASVPAIAVTHRRRRSYIRPAEDGDATSAADGQP
ncbi:hypothetical protein DN412_41375 [Cupriavidus lacunae]|uniref:Uncharacterized protein n=1 Tax=Cupriavidus lacunae TaxID=2666307 RepID=A0A370MXV2_9BURK|nr:hypothetical protein DN412_41375 [Cupriavidus lacunae]